MFHQEDSYRETSAHRTLGHEPEPTHRALRRTAIGIGIAAGALWVVIASDSRYLIGAKLTLGYAILLTLTAVLSLTAVLIGCAMVVLDDLRRREGRQLTAIGELLGAVKREGDASAWGFLNAAQQFVDEGATVRRLRSRG